MIDRAISTFAAVMAFLQVVLGWATYRASTGRPVLPLLPQARGLLRFWPVVVGILLAVSTWALNTRPAEEIRYQSVEREEVANKTFTNEIVQLDGKRFRRCVFENVRLQFAGVKPFDLVDVQFRGTVQLESGSKPLNDALKLAALIHSQSSEVEYGEVDPDGRQVPHYRLGAVPSATPPPAEPSRQP